MNELQAHDLIKKAIEADMAYRTAFVSIHKDDSKYTSVVETMVKNIGIGEQLLYELGQVCYLHEFTDMLKAMLSKRHDEFRSADDRDEKHRIFGSIPMLTNLLEQANVFVAAIDEEIDETEYVRQYCMSNDPHDNEIDDCEDPFEN